MEVNDFLQRIARDGIHVSAKESVEVSQEVIFQGLRWLQEHPRAPIDERSRS